jgi:hypothetical protein
VPEIPGPESNLHIVREPSLKSVDINSRVEEQFGKWRLEVRHKPQVGAIAIQEPFLMFLRLQPT